MIASETLLERKTIILKVRTSTKKKFLVPIGNIMNVYTSDSIVEVIKQAVESRYNDLYQYGKILGTTKTYMPQVVSLTIDGVNILVEMISKFHESSSSNASWKHKYGKKYYYRHDAKATLMETIARQNDSAATSNVCFADSYAEVVLRPKPNRPPAVRQIKPQSIGASIVLSIVKKYMDIKHSKHGIMEPQGVFASLGFNINVPNPKLLPGIVENVYECGRFNRHRSKKRKQTTTREDAFREQELAEWAALSKSNWSAHYVPFLIGQKLLIRNPVISYFGSKRYMIRSEKRCDREMLDAANLKAKRINQCSNPEEVLFALQNELGYSTFDAVEQLANSYFCKFKCGCEYRGYDSSMDPKVPRREWHAARRKGILLALLVENSILKEKFVKASIFRGGESAPANTPKEKAIESYSQHADERKEVTF